MSELNPESLGRRIMYYDFMYQQSVADGMIKWVEFLQPLLPRQYRMYSRKLIQLWSEPGSSIDDMRLLRKIILDAMNGPFHRVDESTDYLLMALSIASTPMADYKYEGTDEDELLDWGIFFLGIAAGMDLDNAHLVTYEFLESSRIGAGVLS